MGIDVFDIVAVILGVWFTIRKLDAQSRQPKDFPHVREEAFLAWQQREVSAYQMGVLGCFSKVLVDLVFTHAFAPDLPFNAARAIGATIDLSWLFVVAVTFVRTSRSRRQRRALGIILGGFVTESEDDEQDDLADVPERDEATARCSQVGDEEPSGPAEPGASKPGPSTLGSAGSGAPSA